jgi:hypothetical protein
LCNGKRLFPIIRMLPRAGVGVCDTIASLGVAFKQVLQSDTASNSIDDGSI